jgi:threonine dehydratase
MPEAASLVKVEGAKSYGAHVTHHGVVYDEAYLYALELAKEKKYTFVHPYEDPWVIAGQGTVALEILEQLPEVSSVVVPIGGGGLISGIAVAIKSLRPQCQVFGIQASATQSMVQSFRCKELAPSEMQGSTIADGIAVRSPSAYMFENYISRFVDDVATVTDEEIAEAIVLLLERTKTVAEGAGAVGLAAALKQKLPLGDKACILVSGGNIDLNIVAKVIESGLARHGRLAKISVIVNDVPGNLSRMTQVIADLRGNILEVHHDRVSQGLYLKETRVDFLIETVSEEHRERIRSGLVSVGARLLPGF